MPTITLSANSTFAATGAASGDTIDLNGFALTVGTQPTQTNISVVTPGKAGTVTISGSYDLSTWSFTAGTGVLITTIPSGCTIGSLTGGTATNASGATTNNGVVTTATGGSGTTAHAIITNANVVTNAIGGPGPGLNSRGVNTNNGLIQSAFGSGGLGCHGVNSNAGLVVLATGGSVSGTYGIGTSTGAAIKAVGSIGVGIQLTTGSVLQAVDGPARAVDSWGDIAIVVDGPNYKGAIVSPVAFIYSIGKLNALATIPSGATVVELPSGAAAGFTGILGLGRGVGT